MACCWDQAKPRSTDHLRDEARAARERSDPSDARTGNMLERQGARRQLQSKPMQYLRNLAGQKQRS